MEKNNSDLTVSDVVKMARGTKYKVQVHLPHRTDFFLKDKSGKNGNGSILVLRDNENNSNWSVSERKYKEGKGGYYDLIKSKLTREEAYNLAKQKISKNSGKMEYGGTAFSSESGEMIGGENQSSMYKNGGVTDVTKKILNDYIFEYHYPKYKRQSAIIQKYKIDTSKTIPIGGTGKDGFNLLLVDGKKTNAVITVIDALKAIKNGEIEFEMSKNYFVKIKAIKQHGKGGKMANGGGVSKRTVVEVGEEEIANIVNKKEKKGFPVYVTTSGYSPQTINLYPTKEKAMTAAKALAKKNGYELKGGKMEWGGTAESSETGTPIGGENQSSMFGKGGSTSSFEYTIGGL